MHWCVCGHHPDYSYTTLGMVSGFAFNAIHAHQRFWRAEWGEVPQTKEETHELLKPILNAVPRLISIHEHYYLLVEPCQAKNPVLSIWQSDIIVYVPDLRTYLLKAWSRILGFMHNFGPSLLCLTTHDQKAVNEERARLFPVFHG